MLVYLVFYFLHEIVHTLFDYIMMHFVDKSESENKKIKVLKLLAVKAACFLKWNLSDLERRYVYLML